MVSNGFRHINRSSLQEDYSRQESKTLNKDICEDLVLVTLICDEVGEAGVCNILHELLKNSSFFQEWGVRPFARPYFRQPPRVEIIVRRLPNNTLGVLIRTKLPEDIHVRVQFSENKIFGVTKICQQNFVRLIATTHRDT